MRWQMLAAGHSSEQFGTDQTCAEHTPSELWIHFIVIAMQKTSAR